MSGWNMTNGRLNFGAVRPTINDMSTDPFSPPTNLIFEIPSGHGDTCPVGCNHCIHPNAQLSDHPPLTDPQVLDLLAQAARMGVTFANIYPHEGDISLEDPARMTGFLAHARQMGLQTKSVTSGISPRGLESLLPHLNRLAVSVDSLDRTTYTELRPPRNFAALMDTLDMLQSAHRRGATPLLTALVMVNKRTLESLEQRVAEIVALELFDRIKLLELLPLGRAGNLQDLALTDKADLERLARLREHYQARGVRVGVPLWRVEHNHRGCQLGFKDFVVGPHGELAGCTLMFYLNQVVGNTHNTSLRTAWQVNLDGYRSKEHRPVSETCAECTLFAHDLCWGGCAARNLIHGEAERLRGCGVITRQDSLDLLAAFQKVEASNPGGKFFAPHCNTSPDGM